MKYYKLGRNTVLWVSLVQFVITFLLFTPLQMYILLPANLINHVLAVVFFGSLVVAMWGLVFKREYHEYKFSYWDVLFVLLVALTAWDNWYTIVTPHPMFHDDYFI